MAQPWQVRLAVGILGAIVLSSTIKVLVDRPRPPAGQMVVAVTGFSFPSGHVTESVAVYGMLSILLGSSTASWTKRVALGAGAVFICLLVGLSRLYLGVHWLTDVLGGYALGALWLAVLVTAVRTLESFPSGGRSGSRRNRGEHASASALDAPTSHGYRQASRRRALTEEIGRRDAAGRGF